jgi:hypothetical protein
MKIAIVSKEAHANSHAKALEEAGYASIMLGGSPVSIPPTVDVVVCRTASCSHGGSDTALAWARAGGGTLIMENGVASMMREVYKLEGRTDEIPVIEDEGPSRIPFDEVLEGARVLSETRSESPEELLSLLQTLYPNEPKSVIRSALASFISIEPVPEESPVAAVNPIVLPVDSKYIRDYGPEKFTSKLEVGVEVWKNLSEGELSEIRAWMNEGKKKTPPCKSVFDKVFGNPHGFIALILLICEKGALTVTDVDSAYDRFVGRKLNTVAVRAVSEALEIPLRNGREKSEPPALPQVIEFPEPSLPPPQREEAQMQVGLRDEEILTMLLKISDQLDALTEKISGVDLKGIENRLDNLTSQVETIRSIGPAPSGNPQDLFANLSKLGLEVTLRPIQK